MVAKIHDIPDVQGSNDTREIAIHRVGIKDIRHPVTILDRRGEPLSTVANLCMTVRLPEHYKGTHMSRFVEILNERERILSVESFHLLLAEMAQRLGAEAGHIDVTFPFFLRKTAPVTGVQSMLDYTVSFIGELGKPTSSFSMVVVIPVTSLCPCSKEISDYGAHNQRAHVTVKAYTQGTLWIEDLIEIVETQASSELYSLLKRPDEKYVTEQAYDNPKFVEDMIRDVAVELNRESRIRAYTLEVENFEAIHNHSAYAMIQVDKDGAAQRQARLG